MTATEALQAARQAGIAVHVDGRDLVLRARARPPTAILDALARHKAELIEMLRPLEGGWSAHDWHAFFEERAAIAEFEGGLERRSAERIALSCCLAEYARQSGPGN